MKKIFIIVAAVLLATACTKENENQQENVKQKPITITAGYDANGAKVTYTESGNTISAVWEAGDEILVVYDGKVSTLTLDAGAGTESATFSGTISYTHDLTSTSVLSCYVRDAQNSSALTVHDDGYITYTDAAFLTQDGTVAGAAKCNTYMGMASYGDGSNIRCNFSVNTSMTKFTITTIAEDSGEGATLEYVSDGTTVAKATFTVIEGNNTVYMAIPAGIYSGEQKLVYKCLGKNITSEYTLGSQANFTPGHTYSKDVAFPIPRVKDLSTLTGDYTAVDGDVLTGSFNFMAYHIYVSDGATVTLRNVKIKTSSSNRGYGIACNGDATIILEGTNEVYGYGITVTEGHTLTIEGNGSLETDGSTSILNGGNAGIGGASGAKCGNIVIMGGTITAQGGGGAAGIGSASYSGNPYNFNITINGGTINATGGQYGTGIGTGQHPNFSFVSIDGATIRLNGGTITAEGGYRSAGIGRATSDNTDVSYSRAIVYIENTVTSVTATKGSDAEYSVYANDESNIHIAGVSQGNIKENYVYTPQQ